MAQVQYNEGKEYIKMFLELTDDGELGKRDMRQTINLLEPDGINQMDLSLGIFSLMAHGLVMLPKLNSPTQLFRTDSEGLEMMRQEAKTDMGAVAEMMAADRFAKTGLAFTPNEMEMCKAALGQNEWFRDDSPPTFRGIRIRLVDKD